MYQIHYFNEKKECEILSKRVGVGFMITEFVFNGEVDHPN